MTPPLPPDSWMPRSKLEPRWATVIGTRNPAFKTHGTVGQAKNAVRAKEVRRKGVVGLETDCWIYKLVGTEWKPWCYLNHQFDPSDHTFFQHKGKALDDIESEFVHNVVEML